jgi:hypothetical protein
MDPTNGSPKRKAIGYVYRRVSASFFFDVEHSDELRSAYHVPSASVQEWRVWRRCRLDCPDRAAQAGIRQERRARLAYPDLAPLAGSAWNS